MIFVSQVIRMILAVLVNLIDVPEMQNILAVCGAQRLLQVASLSTLKFE